MSRSKTILLSSIFANIVLGAIVVGTLFRSVPDDSFAGGGGGEGGRRPVGGAGSGPARTNVTGARDIPVKPWSDFDVGDLTALAARLRAAGYPANVVRAIVGTQLSDRYAARRRELVAKQEENAYWKSGRNFRTDPKVLAALRELAHEEAATLKSVLGDAPRDPGADTFLKYKYGDIAVEKLDAFRGILADYGEMRARIASDTNGVLTPEDREKLAFLAKSQRDDLNKLLTPQELESFDLHTSPLANSLRSQLRSFDPTEDEFVAIYRLKKAYEEQSGPRPDGPIPLAQFNQRRDAQQQLEAQIKAALGDARYATYQDKSSPSYLAVDGLVQRLGKPAETTTQVVAIQREAQRNAAEVTRQNLDPATKNAQLNSLVNEATAKISAALGQAGFQDYKRVNGQWLQNLRPATSTSLPAPPAALVPKR